MGSLFSLIIYRPILNLTVLIYQTIGFGDLGATIIAVTILTRICMLPLSLKAARSQRAMSLVAPEIEKIKLQHKGNTSAQSEAIMQLYRERGISPLSGCLPLLIQFPLLIGLYRVFLNIFKPETLGLLYGALSRPEVINAVAFGIVDISIPNHIMAVAAGVLQFVQARMALQGQPQSSQAKTMNTQMMILLPVMIVVIGWNMPAGLALYWVITTVFSIGEQLYLRRN